MTNDVVRILSAALARKASDIHLSVGRPPVFRVDGALIDQPEASALDGDACRAIVYSFLSEAQRARLEADLELDRSLAALVQRGAISYDDAMARAQDPERLATACRKTAGAL